VEQSARHFDSLMYFFSRKATAIVFVFLLFSFPLLFLQFLLNDYIENHKREKKAQVRSLLQNELISFKKDFDPVTFLGRFLRQKFDCSAVINYLTASGYFSNGTSTQLCLDELRLKLFKRLVMPELKYRPMFIVISDGRLEKQSFYFAPEFLATERTGKFNFNIDSPADLALYLSCFAISGLPKEKVGSFLLDRLEELRNQWGITPKQKEAEHSFFTGVLSSFLKHLPKEGVNRYFSDLFQFENILFYSFPVVQHQQNVVHLSIGYLESDLRPDNIFHQVLEMHEYSNVRRALIDFDQAKFLDENSLVASLPESLAEYFGNKKFLSIMVLPENYVSDAEQMLKALGNSGKVLSLVFWAGFCYLAFFPFRPRFELRFKFMSIFVVSIMVPVVFTAIIFYSITQNYQEVRKNLAGTKVQSELNKLESYWSEIIDRQVLNNLRFKPLLLKDLLEEGPEELSIEKYRHFFGNNVTGSVFYDKFGRHMATTIWDKKEPDTLDKNNAVSALDGLNGLVANTHTAKDLDRHSYTMGFADQIGSFFDLARIAGDEALTTLRLINVSPLSKSQFHLFGDYNRQDRRPFCIAFYDLSPEINFARIIRSMPGFPHKYFQRVDDDFELEMAFALRDTRVIKNEFWNEPAKRRSEHLRNLFRAAISTREDGLVTGGKNRLKVSAYRFSEEVPIIMTGSAKVANSKLLRFWFDLGPWFLGSYLLMVLLLASQAFSAVFLMPIHKMVEAIKYIASKNRPDVFLKLRNHDEFDLLAKAFNSMCQGLVQKKHISRFVSQRLVDELKTGSESKESVKEQQITVLASDIRNFTGISESFSPEVVVDALNDYFTEMEECIVAEQGVVEKFIGDAVIAVFTSSHESLGPINAVAAALRMRKKLESLSQSIHRKTGIFIENGVGIATGAALAAIIGKSCSRREFTIVGDIVERAELLEAISKSGRYSKVIIDKATAKEVHKKFHTEKVNIDKFDAAWEIKQRAEQ
jgi:class 3 adenylate cyclase